VSIPAACRGRAEIKAAYRFFDNHKVTFESVLQPHLDRSVQRVQQQPVALLVQDTTEIEQTRPQQPVAGVGQLDHARSGFLLHEMQAFGTDGTPLGTVWAEVLNRTEGVSDASAPEKGYGRKHTPIEEKESRRWLTGLRAARAVAQRAPGVLCVCIADSEGDIYECFAEPRGNGPVHWLVRGCQDRALDPGPDPDRATEPRPHLRDHVLATPARYTAELRIRGREAKIAGEDRTRRQNRRSRDVTVAVRSAVVALRPPWRHDRVLPPVTVNVVLVREIQPPGDEPAVEWILVTTLPIDTLEHVRAIVEYYCIRWSIEIVFRTLKSGCRIEKRRLEDIDRVLPCVAVYLIVAWRTLFVCRMGHSCPELDCETIFEPSEWKAVWVAVRRQGPPKKPPRLGVMVHLIASLGGYIERKDSEPGPQTVWIGLQRMYDLAWAWESFGPEATIPSGPEPSSPTG
jgi:hypothetical protein